MPPTWKVEDAVKEVMTEINGGAPGIDLSPDAYGELEKYYLLRFEERWSKGADWDKDKAKVLPLAYLVGVLAAADETSQSLPQRPREISTKTAKRWAGLVAQVRWCPKNKMLGGYCDPPIKPFTPLELFQAAIQPSINVFGDLVLEGLAAFVAAQGARRKAGGSKRAPGKAATSNAASKAASGKKAGGKAAVKPARPSGSKPPSRRRS